MNSIMKIFDTNLGRRNAISAERKLNITFRYEKRRKCVAKGVSWNYYERHIMADGLKNMKIMSIFYDKKNSFVWTKNKITVK